MEAPCRLKGTQDGGVLNGGTLSIYLSLTLPANDAESRQHAARARSKTYDRAGLVRSVPGRRERRRGGDDLSAGPSQNMAEHGAAGG